MRHKSLPRAQKGKIVKNLFKKTVNISDDEISKAMRMAERARLKEGFKAIDKADKGVKSNLVPKKKMGGMYLNGGDTTKTKPLYPQAVPPRTPTKRPNIPKPNITKSVDSYIRNPVPEKAKSVKKMGGSTLPKAQLGKAVKSETKKELKKLFKANVALGIGAGGGSYLTRRMAENDKKTKSKLIPKKK